MDSGFTGLRLMAAALALALLALLSGCGAGGSSSPPDWFYHWNCNGDSECLATNPTGAPSGTSDEGPNESSCTELLQFAQNFWNMPPATDSCDQDSSGSSSGGSAAVTISGFSPASTAPGNNVTIDGSGFTSSTTVTVDGVACTVVSVTGTEIVVTLPGIGDFTGPIVVGGVSSTDITIVNHYFGVTSSSNQVVAVGGNTTLSGSTDGATWRTVDLSSSDYLSAIASSGTNTLVTVGEAGSIYTNTAGGASFLPHTSGTSQNLFGVAWSGSLFAAVGANGVILTSPDGVTWTPRTSNTHNTLAGVAWCTAQFVVVGASGTIETSPDGITWTPQNSGSTSFLNGVGCSGSAIAVGVGTDGTGGEILSSPTGTVWTPHALSATDAVYGIAWSGTGFVAVGFGGAVYTSPDGSNWTTHNSGSTQSLNAVTWSALLSQFVVVGGFGTILTSPNGTTWTARGP